MTKGYWIVRVDVTDMEQYKRYVAANAEPLRKYGGRFLVRFWIIMSSGVATHPSVFKSGRYLFRRRAKRSPWCGSLPSRKSSMRNSLRSSVTMGRVVRCVIKRGSVSPLADLTSKHARAPRGDHHQHPRSHV